jgi:hypothetical protein
MAKLVEQNEINVAAYQYSQELLAKARKTLQEGSPEIETPTAVTHKKGLSGSSFLVAQKSS